MTARVGDGSSCAAFAQIKQRVRALARLVRRCISGICPDHQETSPEGRRLAQNRLLRPCEYFAQVALAENNIRFANDGFWRKAAVRRHRYGKRSCRVVVTASPARQSGRRADTSRSGIRTNLQRNFPANREFYVFGPSEANFVARNPCAAGVSRAIPYASFLGSASCL